MSNRKVRKAKAESRAEIAAELQRLSAEHKGLKPSIVVAEAEPKSSPLHNEFEWDDRKAGHQYRLDQARTLIRIVVPLIPTPSGMAPDRFVHVPPPKGSGEGVYLPTSVVVQSPDAFARALNELQARVRSAQAAAEELRDAAMTTGTSDADRMARIAMAITALQTAGAAVQALH